MRVLLYLQENKNLYFVFSQKKLCFSEFKVCLKIKLVYNNLGKVLDYHKLFLSWYPTVNIWLASRHKVLQYKVKPRQKIKRYMT